MGRATARPPTQHSPTIKAPLFREVVERMDGAGRRIILDLGAASTPMLDLLGRYRCRVEIADLADGDGIARLNAGEPPADAALAESLLPAHATTEPVDLVFCWDLPNYLEPAATAALVQAIAGRCRVGTQLHALIVYSERSMPEKPGRYRPGEDMTITNVAAAGAEIPAPRYSPEDLGRIMYPFRIDRARLLANGMQEFLLQLPD